MKTDRFMQGILVGDDDELFSYQPPKHDHGLRMVVNRLKKLKKNLTNFKYVTQYGQSTGHNKQAVFSKTTIDGSVEEAITEVWDRLHIKHENSEE